eukprot:2925595-Prorocentrum_lima.AAC.1
MGKEAHLRRTLVKLGVIPTDWFDPETGRWVETRVRAEPRAAEGDTEEVHAVDDFSPSGPEA